MKYENLSKHSEHFHLVCDTADGKEYWAGGSDWVTDPDNPEVSILGALRALEWHTRMINRGINAYLEPAHTSIQLCDWKGIGWVGISAVTGKAHRVKFVNSRGQGWYIKDVGTIEQTLCINYSKDVYADILIRGDQIGEVNYYVQGEGMVNFRSFTIPTDSNLIYQFELEQEPIPELS